MKSKFFREGGSMQIFASITNVFKLFFSWIDLLNIFHLKVKE